MKPLEQRTKTYDYVLRPYRTEDRERIRFICCETGFLGNPIDEVFGDRDVFADYLTRYYTDAEPESSWVGEKNGEVVGYLLSCKRWHWNRWWCFWNNLRIAAKVACRFLLGRYDARSRKFLGWILLKGRKENPATPRASAHFHFNSLKDHRRMGIARDLVVTMLDDLKKHGVRQVYGQMATYDHRRTARLYEYMGWKVIDKKKVTKYQDKLDKELWLTTIIKEV
ncbi:MAG: GNAT family N-acetyltransferase [Verrucomicrobiae bacterium]|nr:GNAT family N-acetyltransferase [Verrucomicrobiae bacterium]